MKEKGGATRPWAMLNQAPKVHYFWHRAGDCSIHLACLLVTVFLGSCAAPDTRHQIVISAREQKLALLDRGNLMAIYPVSTSKFGPSSASATGPAVIGLLWADSKSQRKSAIMHRLARYLKIDVALVKSLRPIRLAATRSSRAFSG